MSSNSSCTPQCGGRARLRVGLVLGLALLVSGTGCSLDSGSNNDQPQSIEQIAKNARQWGYTWQAEQLEDGDITLAEYDEGVRRLLECVTEAGLTYDELSRNKVDGFHWNYIVYFRSEETADADSTTHRDCYNQYASDLELAMNSWGDWTTDPALMADIEDCLERGDVEFERGVAKNYRDLLKATADQGVTEMFMTACIENGMERLYPELEYAVAY